MSSELQSPTGAVRGAFVTCVLGALRLALNWRVLLLWLLALALPLVIMMLPLAMAVGERLNHSLMGVALAERGELTVLAELAMGLGQAGYNPAGPGVLGLAMTLLLSPWLTGLVLAQARADRRLTLGGLIQGGLLEYGRMFRMLIWAILPLGLAAAAMGALGKAAGDHAAQAILERDADRWQHLALAAGALLFLIAHASVDAGRALLVAEPRRRSVVLAWARALRRLFSQPSTLLAYLVITVLGLALAAVLGWARLQVAPASGLSVALAWLLGQAIVLALVWMRCARLLALIGLARR